MRFRPNLIVEGCRPFEEDTWKRIRCCAAFFRHFAKKRSTCPATASHRCVCCRIGGESGVVLELHRACKRCQVTTFDPNTAKADAGTSMTTLSALKSHRAAFTEPSKENPEVKKEGLFGQYAIHKNDGHILVNQCIEVLEYKRRSDVKHTLQHPNTFEPHSLKSNFQSFRVLSSTCDDDSNPRPMHRITLEVQCRPTLKFYSWLNRHCCAGQHVGRRAARRLARAGVSRITQP